MVKLPRSPLDDDDFEAPTLKRNVPAELRDASEERAPAAVHALGDVTTKLHPAEIAALLEKERAKSGMRPAVSEEEIERFARREIRETIPAPPELSQMADEVANLDADDGR